LLLHSADEHTEATTVNISHNQMVAEQTDTGKKKFNLHDVNPHIVPAFTSHVRSSQTKLQSKRQAKSGL